jgi:hypothetical protein
MSGVPVGAAKPKARTGTKIVQWVPDPLMSGKNGSTLRPDIQILELEMESNMGYNRTLALRKAIGVARDHGMNDTARRLGNKLGGIVLGYRRRGEEEPTRETLTMITGDWFRILSERHRLFDLQRKEEKLVAKRLEDQAHRARVAEVDRTTAEAFGQHA